MRELSDLFVGICPKIWGLQALRGYISLVILLSFFWSCFLGCAYSDLFVWCVLLDMRTILSEGICPRMWGLCCVWSVHLWVWGLENVCGCSSQDVSSLNSLWLYVPECEVSVLSIPVSVLGHEVSFHGCMSRVWALWYFCVGMSQGMRSLIFLFFWGSGVCHITWVFKFVVIWLT